MSVRVLPHVLAAAGMALVALSPVPAAAVRMSVSLSQTSIAGGYQYDYTVTDGNTTSSFSIFEIIIPELHAGDLVASTLPTGWAAAETTTSLNSNVNITSQTTGANLTLSTSITADEIPANGGSADFIFTSLYGGNLSSKWIDFDHAGSGSAFGVLIPDSTTPLSSVPEPGTIAIFGLGLSVLGGVRRRCRETSATA